ncbi:MAG TPA: sulfotransferase domain-containing protein [Bacteroidales bacterium]|nr:sulfotransferase domain-containing protein [Bacteroidales bacterium]
MHSSGKIVWLASYPKSGNTWFRIFLANLLRNSDTPANINELEGGPIASSRQLFDEATGLSSADLTPDEIENLRPEVYKYISAESESLIFHKIHDAFVLTGNNEPLIPKEATYKALYFVRNPLDVAVSFSHHANLPVDTIVKQMNDDQFAFCSRTDKLHNQLCQKLLSWSHHIQSWTNQTDFPVHVMRYEDMKTNAFETFKKATEFAGLEYTDMQIQRAIGFSDFKTIKSQEEQYGFREKAPGSKEFFRKGKIGSWKEELSETLIKTLINEHREMMLRFGYINAKGNIMEF